MKIIFNDIFIGDSSIHKNFDVNNKFTIKKLIKKVERKIILNFPNLKYCDNNNKYYTLHTIYTY